MLGISWGIVSVVMLLAYGNGFHARSDAGFRGAFGNGVVGLVAGQTSMQAGGERAGRRVRLTVDDVEALARAAAGQVRQPEYVQDACRSLRRQADELPASAAWRPPTG